MTSILTQPEEKRLARLEKYIQRAEDAVNSLNLALQNGQFEAFTEEQIRFHLTHDPDIICDCGLLVAKFRRAYLYAQNDSKTIRAEIRKKCNQRKADLGLSSASDRDDYVQTDPEYKRAIEQEIEFKFQLERIERVYDRYMNLYIGVRKLASMFTKEMYDHGI